MDSDIPADNDTADDVDDAEEGATEDSTSDEGDGETPPAAGDEDTPPADTVPEQDDDSVQDLASSDSADPQVSSRSASAQTFALPRASDVVDSTVTVAAGQPNRSGRQQSSQTFKIAAVADDPARHSFASASTAALTAATTVTAAAPAPAVPQQRSTLVSVFSDLVAAVLQPLLSPGKGSPIQIPILTAMLPAVRDELERIFLPRKVNGASQHAVALVTDSSTQPSPLVDPTQQHVLVIGVDGTNFEQILADDENENFFGVIDTGTTAASSIVGHTTISNPSWTAILTGAWGERTGVINNVFTPWTYDKWPTVFNQLEAFDSDIETTTIADWDVISAIAGAGSIPPTTSSTSRRSQATRTGC